MTMTTNDKVELFLRILKMVEERKGREAVQSYMSGNCGNLYYMLKKVFPQAEAYGMWNSLENKICRHIITKIDGNFYDIKGVREIKDPSKIKPVTKEDCERNSNNYTLINIVKQRGVTDRMAQNLRHSEKERAILIFEKVNKVFNQVIKDKEGGKHSV